MTSSDVDILAIDDDEDTIEGLLSEFDLLGYSTDIARTIQEASKKLRKNIYRVLFIDLRMKMSPDGDVKDDAGLDLIRKLRKGKLGPINQKTPYILITAQEFWIDRLEARIAAEELKSIRAGRITKFSKGDSLTPLVTRIVAALNPNEKSR